MLAHSLLPGVGWGEELRKKAKLLSWDKDSLTEQQRKRKRTTIIVTKSAKWVIHSAIFSLPNAQPAPEQWFPSSSQLPQLYTDMTPCEYPIWMVWVSCPSFLWKLTLSQLNPGQSQLSLFWYGLFQCKHMQTHSWRKVKL